MVAMAAGGGEAPIDWRTVARGRGRSSTCRLGTGCAPSARRLFLLCSPLSASISLPYLSRSLLTLGKSLGAAVCGHLPMFSLSHCPACVFLRSMTRSVFTHRGIAPLPSHSLQGDAGSEYFFRVETSPTLFWSRIYFRGQIVRGMIKGREQETFQNNFSPPVGDWCSQEGASVPPVSTCKEVSPGQLR